MAVCGASLAGLRAAQTLRAEGHRGPIVMIGEERHLPYDRPPLSKQVLAGTWPAEKAVLADRKALDELAIDLRMGVPAVGCDPETGVVTLADGTAVGAGGIVLATGAQPRLLPGLPPPGGRGPVHVLRTLDDEMALRARLGEAGASPRVVVVGAGFIGSEVAATCAQMGCRVTVVEISTTPLAGALGEQVGAAVAALHGIHGVALRTGVGVAQVRAAGPVPAAPPGSAGSLQSSGAVPAGAPRGPRGAVEVVLSDASTLEADVVVVGIGVAPSTGWLSGTGLGIQDGVRCDRALFAADGVVAAGDVARWDWEHDETVESVRIEHWQVAAEAGVAAARSLLAGRRQAPAFRPVPYFWSDQYGLRIQVLGHPDPADELVVVDGALTTDPGADQPSRFFALYGRRGRLSGAVALSRPRPLMAVRPLLERGCSLDEALASARSA